MNISIFDSEESEIEFEHKFDNLQSMIFIADTLVLWVNAAWANMFTLDVETLADEQLLAYNLSLYKNNKKSVEEFESVGQFLKSAKKVKKIKLKSKEGLYVFNRYMTGIKLMKNSMTFVHKGFVKFHQLEELYPFVGDGIWQVPFVDYINDPKKEDVFIQPICEKMQQRDNLFVLDEKLEDFYLHSILEAPENTACDFIKIPLWEIQLAKELTYNQIKYTRDDLQPALLPFKTNLKELSEALIGINFLPENMARIKQLCGEKLLEHIAPVQQSLNDSLYLSHLRNQSAENTDSKLFLGIASAEMLLNYFDKIKLVQPYVISEIKQRLARHFDLKASCIFSYLQIHPSSIIPPETNASQ